ncbi:MAG TPA: MFS transporter [Oscillatoriaceae cyanobacterium M33_DOE_052]|uniref:MFS transporter n=1 Tax=Planktothricoides sp. SpSt-374 TaxID=2282167 RepID=A0A7C3ZPE8_9CYAN|nr:MFS transporter [Oscillatoriaceae cyanobacterium M33_DOE_052]
MSDRVSPSGHYPPPPTQIMWRQVIGLSGLSAAITLTWVIYNAYLGKLLVQFGFTPQAATTVLVVENILALGMEPLWGGLSDRAERWFGHRFLLISFGVVTASAIFVAIPACTILIKPLPGVKLLLPVLMVVWALAMTIFRAPALSLLGKYATTPQLPKAASFLTLAGGIVAAFAPRSQELILNLGPGVTFTIGSLVLLATAAALRALDPPGGLPQTRPQTTATPQPVTSPILLLRVGVILATGAAIFCSSSFLMNVFSQLLKAQLPQQDTKLLMFWFTLGSAVAALPAGTLATKVGNRQGMLGGMAGTVAGLLLLGLAPSPGSLLLAGIIWVAGLSLVNNGAIPFAISLMPNQWKGLGVGSYFGGIGAAKVLFGVVFPTGLAQMAPTIGVIWASITCLAAAISVALSFRFPPHHEI